MAAFPGGFEEASRRGPPFREMFGGVAGPPRPAAAVPVGLDEGALDDSSDEALPAHRVRDRLLTDRSARVAQIHVQPGRAMQAATGLERRGHRRVEFDPAPLPSRRSTIDPLVE